MIPSITPNWIGAPANVGAFTTLRSGGISQSPYDDGLSGQNGLNLAGHVGDNPEHVEHNRTLLRTQIPSEPAWLAQVHGTHVVDAATVDNQPEADASFTTARNTVCAVLTADCLPVLFCDTAGTVVAAAHAGWRGLAGGVLEQTVQRMRDAGAKEIIAWLGSAIGPQQFEVGEDVREAFADKNANAASAFQPRMGHNGKYLADLYALAKLALANAGVTRVFGGNHCTVTERERFYSYRRAGVTGRMVSVIWLK